MENDRHDDWHGFRVSCTRNRKNNLTSQLISTPLMRENSVRKHNMRASSFRKTTGQTGSVYQTGMRFKRGRQLIGL